MITCTQCQLANSVDSLFCRGCGAAISADMAADARAKLDELIADGYKIFSEGRTEEADLVADNALVEDPTNLSALSLKGMCLERTNELPKALEVYEKILELNPGSALDRIKIQHLRNTLSTRLLRVREPRKTAALMPAIAAAVLVVALGATLALAFPPGSAPKKDLNSAVAMGDGGPGTMTSLPEKGVKPTLEQDDPALSVPGANQDQTGQRGGDQRVPPEGSNPGPGATGEARTSEPTRSNRISGDVERPSGVSGNQLPDPGRTAYDPGNIPLTFSGPINVESSRPNNGNTGNAHSSRNPAQPAKPDPNDVEPKVEKPRTGYVDIKVSGNSKPPTGGSIRTAEPMGAEALVRTANQHFILGKYDQAARTYEAAIAQGAGSPTVYQRIAQCYEHLGRKSDAANAYRQAISILESRVANGGSTRDQSALEACRQALQILGG